MKINDVRENHEQCYVVAVINGWTPDSWAYYVRTEQDGTDTPHHYYSTSFYDAKVYDTPEDALEDLEKLNLPYPVTLREIWRCDHCGKETIDTPMLNGTDLYGNDQVCERCAIKEAAQRWVENPIIIKERK